MSENGYYHVKLRGIGKQILLRKAAGAFSCFAGVFDDGVRVACQACCLHGFHTNDLQNAPEGVY